MVPNRRGVTQGCPLATGCFCLTIQEPLEIVSNNNNDESIALRAICDDVKVLAGAAAADINRVWELINELRALLKPLGISINKGKSKIVCSATAASKIRTGPDQCDYPIVRATKSLGTATASHDGDKEAAQIILNRALGRYSPIFSFLTHPDTAPTVTLTLLRACLVRTLTHVVRTTPQAIANELLAWWDARTTEALENALNIKPTADQLAILKLPTGEFGGAGYVSATDYGGPAFYAAAAEDATREDQALPPHLQTVLEAVDAEDTSNLATNALRATNLISLNTTYGTVNQLRQPDGSRFNFGRNYHNQQKPVTKVQRSVTTAKYNTMSLMTTALVKEAGQEQVAIRRHLLADENYSVVYNSFPSYTPGNNTYIYPGDMAAHTRLLTGTPLPGSEHPKYLTAPGGCGCPMSRAKATCTRRGAHALACPQRGAITDRHDAIVELLYKYLRAFPELNVSPPEHYMDPGNSGNRMDLHITYTNEERQTRQLYLDIFIICPHSKSNRQKLPETAFKTIARTKHNKYRDQVDDNGEFYAGGLTVYGTMSKEMQNFIARVQNVLYRIAKGNKQRAKEIRAVLRRMRKAIAFTMVRNVMKRWRHHVNSTIGSAGGGDTGGDMGRCELVQKAIDDYNRGI